MTCDKSPDGHHEWGIKYDFAIGRHKHNMGQAECINTGVFLAPRDVEYILNNSPELVEFVVERQKAQLDKTMVRMRGE